MAKKKRPRINKICKAIKQQLAHLKRTLTSIDALNGCGAGLLVAGRYVYQQLLVVSELVRQQNILYHSDSRSIPDRIVSLSQAHIRAIVRGKARCNVEFGVKISISVTGGGFAFLDDQRQRNAVEGKIGQGKRRFGLGLIREKLAVTQGSAIAMTMLVMNLEKLLQLLFVLFAFWLEILGTLNRPLRGHNSPESMHAAAA